MSLLVDDREGSKQLAPLLDGMGLSVEVTRLEFGDVAFVGRGMRGVPLTIGLEHKRVSDLVQSLSNDRLAGHQLPGMLQTYDRCYLVIEGDWERDTSGRVVVAKKKGGKGPLQGAPPAIELLKRLHTLSTRGGLTIWNAKDQRGSLDYIYSLYRFWTDVDLDRHRSHIAVAADIDVSLLSPTSRFRKKIRGIEGVGVALGLALEKACNGSLRRLVAMTVAQLADVQTRDEATGKLRRLGESRAAKLHKELD